MQSFALMEKSTWLERDVIFSKDWKRIGSIRAEMFGSLYGGHFYGKEAYEALAK